MSSLIPTCNHPQCDSRYPCKKRPAVTILLTEVDWQKALAGQSYELSHMRRGKRISRTMSPVVLPRAGA